MNKQICVVTGASQGIGKATARGLAEMGATVVMVARDPARGLQALTETIEATGNNNIHLELSDLSRISSVKYLAGRLCSRYPAINVLINNHAALFPSFEYSEDEIEMTFALNHLSYFLLTNLLIENLKRGRGRIVNVTAHVHVNIERGDFLDQFCAAESYNSLDAYCQSKLSNILFTYALARRLQGSGVTVNCLHPGTAKTLALKTIREIYTSLHGPTEFTKPSPVESVAETSLYLATSPEVSGVTGKYFKNREATPSSDLSYDIALQEKLWQLSSELTQLEQVPG